MEYKVNVINVEVGSLHVEIEGVDDSGNTVILEITEYDTITRTPMTCDYSEERHGFHIKSSEKFKTCKHRFNHCNGDCYVSVHKKPIIRVHK